MSSRSIRSIALALLAGVAVSSVSSSARASVEGQPAGAESASAGMVDGDAAKPPSPRVAAELWVGRRPTNETRRDVVLGAVRPRWQGVALATGAGLAGAVLWATTLARAGLAHCQPSMDTGAATQPCSDADSGLASLGNLGYIGAWRAASVGARMLGHRDAVTFAEGTGKRRAPAAYIGSGAALFALGLGSWLGTQAVAAAPTCTDAATCTSLERGRLGSLALSNTLIAAGGGLLAYGIAYERASGRLQRSKPIGHLRISAQLATTYAGISLGGRF